MDVNINMTMDDLISLENRVNMKKETLADYEMLNSFLVKLGLPENYFLNQLKIEGIYSFKELNQFRTSPPEQLNPVRAGKVGGILIGLISFLKNKL